MNTIDAILTRRTAHFFECETFSEDWVSDALAAAIRAPNHRLTNPWRFTRVGEKARGRLVSLALELKGAKRELSESEVERIRSKVGDAPVLMCFSQVLDDDPFVEREDYASVACAIQNYTLALWDYGISSKWSTGGWALHEETYEILEIDQDAERIVGMVLSGYPKKTPNTGRRPLTDVYRSVE